MCSFKDSSNVYDADNEDEHYNYRAVTKKLVKNKEAVKKDTDSGFTSPT